MKPFTAVTIQVVATFVLVAIVAAAHGKPPPREIAFVDARVADRAHLLAGGRRLLDVVIVAPGSDGIGAIGDALASRGAIDAVHIVSHGAEGIAELGASRLDAESLETRRDEIASWRDSLEAGSDLLLYGCDIARGAGRGMVERLASLTGADVAASDDATGAPTSGGDWELEYRTGAIAAALAVDKAAQESWPGLLPIAVNRTDSAATAGAQASLSWPHTVNAGSNRFLLVGLSMEGGQATGVTYGGTPLVLVGRYSGTGHTIEQWGLAAPPEGAANVVATFDSVREVIGGATTFNGVDQASSTSGFAGNTGVSGTASVTIASAAGDLVVDTVFVDLNVALSPDPGQSQLWNLANGRAGGGSTKPGAASVPMSWSLGSEEWTIAAVSLKTASGSILSGRVFEDADFAGTATGYDGGVGDLALQGVDVELYDGATDAFLATTATDASGNYTFASVADGSYKVRVRSATIGSGTATPRGGLNATVPGTWPNPLPELTWADGAALYGGQSPTVDDTATGNDAGPGDTWTPVTVSGADVTGVNFGFSYNLIVNTMDDANADSVRSVQGSLRQWLKNANAIGGAGGTTANISEFRLPASDPNYSGGTGVYAVTPVINLPPIADAGTTLDGATQTANGGNSNAAVLGTGGTVGVDSLALGQVAGPEVELRGGGVRTQGLRIEDDGATVRGLAIVGFGTGGSGEGAIHVNNAVTGALIENNVIGASAHSFVDPGPGSRNYENVFSGGADGGTIRNNLIGFGGIRGVLLETGSTGWTVSGNEVRDCSLEDGFGDGVAVNGDSNTITGNLIVGAASQAYVVATSTGTSFTNNTVTGNGVGIASVDEQSAAIAMRSSVTSATIDRNIVSGNYGAGIQVNDGARAVLITRNSVFDNGTVVARNGDPASGQIGIDLNAPGDNANLGTAPFYTLNDSADGDGGGNALQNFPVLDTALVFGSNLELSGWARPGSVIEVFDAASDPTGFGEGQTYAITLTEGGTGSGGEDSYADLDGSSSGYGPGAVNGIVQGTDTTERFRFLFPLPPGVVVGTTLTATARNGSNDTSEFSGQVTVAAATADLALTMTDSPDPAPLNGPLVYTLLVTNNGPGTATAVTVTNTLPASVVLQSATPSQGSCTGSNPVTCNLGAIVSTGTASVEILVTTGATGTLTNSASVSANEDDPVPGNDSAVENTEVVADSAIFDLPLTQYRRIHGFIDYAVTGASLRTQPNGGGGQSCQVGPTASATLSGIPATATVSAAYLYWAGSGATVDANVTFDGSAVTADRSFQGRFSLGSTDYEFFGGFEDVTAQVTAKRNGSYSLADLSVDTANPYCNARAVLAGWSLITIYSDPALSGKTLVLYDGFDIERNGAMSYLLTGIYSADPPEAKTTFLTWEGDEDLAEANEFLEFNGTMQTDGLNPVNNVFNSTINSLGSTTTYGMDLDTFDVSGLISAGDTLATTQVSVGPDLVILNAVVLQAKSNLIAGFVFDDVNYGGGAGRNRSTAAADAASFAIARPGATVELYDAGGNFLRTTTTDGNGEYGFAGLVDGNYQVRVVNDTVGSARPGATGAELGVQTFRTDATSGTPAAVVSEVGGANPAAAGSPVNAAMAPLGTLTAQSVAPVLITTGIAVPNVDFGYNFDTVVNASGAGQGSLRQFILNASLLTNANLDQSGRTTGVETSIFMIPSDADPWGRAADPNFDAGRGVATIDVGAGRLPPLTDAATYLDGTTQTALVGDSNGGTAGNPELGGAAVGTGGDGVEGTGDEPALPSYPQPEIEIDGNDQGIVLEIASGGSAVRGLAVFNAPSAPTGVLVSAGSGSVIDGNLLGVTADGADPGAGARVDHAIEVFGGAADVTNNYVAFTENTAIIVDNDATVSGNDIYRAALGNADGDGISVEGSTGPTIDVRNNRVDRTAGYGFESWNATGPFTVEDNTFSRSGEGGGVENGGVRLFGTASTVLHNVVTGSAGAGVVLAQRSAPGSNLQNRLSQNAIYQNGGTGIDLDVTNTGLVNPNGDGVTANDGTVDATLPNRVIDYPVITGARLTGTTLRVAGFVGTPSTAIAGTHTLEFFKADDDGNNNGETIQGDALSVAHGEGRWYLDACTSAPDGTFDCNLTVPAAVALANGDAITATTTDTSNNTSEFSTNGTVRPPLAIVKRAFQFDGTPITSGSTAPSGVLVKILMYIDNAGPAVPDVSMQDALDPLFAYVGGTIKVDNTLDAAVACPGGVCDEAVIFAQVDAAGIPLGDGDTVVTPIDADAGSYDSGTSTVHLGASINPNNAQLDLAANRVLALLFTVRIQ